MTANAFQITTGSQEATRALGRTLGGLLAGGEILGLTGDLGSGKTCFVHGLAEGLEVGRNSWVRSPTFTLINEYDGRVPLVHVDLFRVAQGAEMEDLHLEEYFASGSVCVIEWFERLDAVGVDEFLAVAFRYVDEDRRELRFAAHGPRYDELVAALRQDDGAARDIAATEPVGPEPFDKAQDGRGEA